MKRFYDLVIRGSISEKTDKCSSWWGLRQVGKTTASLEIAEAKPKHFYLNWDSQEDRRHF